MTGGGKRRNRIVRLVVAAAFGIGVAATGAMVSATDAGATGSTPAPFSITVNGANTTSSTASAVSSLVAVGLPTGATGTVTFASGTTVLCVATLPTTSCASGVLANGTYPGVAGTYSGDGTYAGGTSTNSVDLTVGAGAGTSLACRKVFGYTTRTATFAKCGPMQQGAHLPGADLLTGGVLTWAKPRTTTTYTGSATSPGLGSCTVGHVEEDFSGTVTADTSGYVVVGDAVTFQVCVNSASHVVKLLPHTTGTL